MTPARRRPRSTQTCVRGADYEPERTELAVGDLVRITRNDGAGEQAEHPESILEARRESLEDRLIELRTAHVAQNVPGLCPRVFRGPERIRCAFDRDEVPAVVL